MSIPRTPFLLFADPSKCMCKAKSVRLLRWLNHRRHCWFTDGCQWGSVEAGSGSIDPGWVAPTHIRSASRRTEVFRYGPSTTGAGDIIFIPSVGEQVGIEFRRAGHRWRVTSLPLSFARWDLAIRSIGWLGEWWRSARLQTLGNVFHLTIPLPFSQRHQRLAMTRGRKC